MNLTLYRIYSGDQGTIGELVYNGVRICFINELPWRGNKQNISHIPDGVYQVDYLARSASGKYRNVYHIKNVPGRSGVLMHAGNFAGDILKRFKSHSWGCILPGLRLGRLNNQRCVLASRAALNKIHKITNRKNFILEVKNV